MRKLHIVLAAVAAFALSASPAKADWPNDKPIKMVIPFSPGGGFDTYVRAMAPLLEKELGAGVTVVPENVSGAGGLKGSALIFRAEPDGYTFGILNIPGLTLSKVRDEELSFDPENFTWVANLANSTYGITVAGKSEINSVKDLCNLGRPAKFAQTGPTATAYVAGKIAMEIMGCEYKMVTGYKGTSEAITAILRGEVDASIRPLGSTKKYFESGDLKVLLPLEEKAATEAGFPELGNLTLKRMFAGPPDMPVSIVERLSAAMIRAANTDTFKKFVADTGDDLAPVDGPAAKKINTDLLNFYGKYKKYLVSQ